jgi:hypothetical protein
MIAKLLLQNLIWIVAMGALLFVPAGTLHWPAAWVFLGTIAILGISGGLWLAKTDPALLDQRMRSRACRAMLITRRGCAIVCCRGFGEAYTADDAVHGADADRCPTAGPIPAAATAAWCASNAPPILLS